MHVCGVCVFVHIMFDMCCVCVHVCVCCTPCVMEHMWTLVANFQKLEEGSRCFLCAAYARLAHL